MNYKKYSDADLIESYSSMLAYTGKASDEILSEIEARGGLDKFLKQIEYKKRLDKERARITVEIRKQMDGNLRFETIQNLITSTLIDEESLKELIELKYNEYQAIRNDRSVNSKTILGSILGIIIGGLLGFGFYCLLIYFFQSIFYFPIVGVYLICYFTIRFITKQSRNNILIFIASLFSTILAVVLTFYVVRSGILVIPN
jgi:phosphate starvation-inducible membrane PsiE